MTAPGPFPYGDSDDAAMEEYLYGGADAAPEEPEPEYPDPRGEEWDEDYERTTQ